jgi:MYXO-CTERM domain-containing protein
MKFTLAATAASVAAFAGVAIAGTATVYTDSASFLADLAPGFYTNGFDDVSSGPSPDLTYSQNGFAYNVGTQVGAVSGLFNDFGVISTDNAGDSISVDFTSGNVFAVGGNFWATDIAVLPTGTDIVISLSDGTSVSYTSTGPSDFRGFISDVAITNLTIDAPDGLSPFWATMDNLTVGQAIPTPGAVALLGVAGLAGVRRRR